MTTTTDTSIATNAAVAALNVAVVRQVVFEREAERLADRQDEAAREVEETTSENRARIDATDSIDFSSADPARNANDSNPDGQEQQQSTPQDQGVDILV